MTRGSSLSDEKIIQLINEKFVAVNLNLSNEAFPSELKALAPWQKALAQVRKKSPPKERGFSTTVILTSDAQKVLATSGAGYHTRFKDALNYKSGDYLTFLRQASKRATDLKTKSRQRNPKELKDLEILIEKEIEERNKGYQE